jgi:Flp pilus assembly protein TadD
LVPVIGLIQVGSQSMADRYTYVPLLGVFIMMTWGAAQWASSRPNAQRTLSALAGLAVLGCLIKTSFQLENWQNCITLFDHALKVTENNYLAHNNLAAALKPLGKIEEANVHFLEAIRIKPDYAMAHYNLAINLTEAGDVTPALHHFSEVARLHKDTVDKRHTFALVLGRKGHWLEAIDQFTEVLRREPGFAKAHFNLAYAFCETGEPLQAIDHYRAALRLRPDWPEAMQNLAWLLATTEGPASGDSTEAIQLAKELCSLTGHQSAVPLDVLAAACAQAGRFPDAVSAATKASRLAADAGQQDLAKQIQQRLQLYQTGKAYRAPHKDDSPVLR